MPGKAAKITITERQKEILQTFSRSVTAPSRLRQRASIIVLAFDGLLNEDIAARVGLTHRQVGRWRRRWARAWNQLIDIECCESRAALRRAIEAILSDGLDHRFGHFVWASDHQIEAKPYGIGPSFTRTAVHWPKR